jgi:hypothetical protein
MKTFATYLLLLAVKTLSRVFFTLEVGWVGEPVAHPWDQDVRICAILHHTSLYEPIFAAVAPNRFLRRIASRGVIPVADKTLRRPVVGRFFRLVAHQVVAVTRQRDETWREVVSNAGARSMICILPEGRMKRTTGLDSEGKPMTVRGGIADLIEAVGGGYMLLAYSGGLHHVQAPGERLPRLFQTVRMNLELVDIASYRAEMVARGRGRSGGFRRAVVDDLEGRRDRLCPLDASLLGAPEGAEEAVDHRSEERSA